MVHRWSTARRVYFTPNAFSTYKGLTPTRGLRLLLDESDYTRVGTHLIEIKFITLSGYDISTAATLEETMSFDLNLVDPRCVPVATEPTVSPTYNYYIGKADLVVELVDLTLGDCMFFLGAHANDVSLSLMIDSSDSQWISTDQAQYTVPDASFPR